MRLDKVAKGLLGAFNLKTLGKNPAQFADVLQPTADVLDLYTADIISNASNASVGEVAAASISIAVDSQHLWLMRAVSARIDFVAGFNAAANQIRCTLQYIPAAGAPQFYFDSLSLIPADFPALPLVATFSVFLHQTFPKPFLLLPGSQVELSCSAVATAGSYNLSSRVDVAAPFL